MTEWILGDRLAGMDWLTWGALILSVSVLILDLVLISDAAYQIVSEKPSFIGLERAVFKRVPATPEDCLRQGAGKLLTYIAILLIQVPMFFIVYVNALGGFPPSQRWLDKAIALAGMVCVGLGLLLAVSGTMVGRRVRFTYLDRVVNQP